MTIREFRQNLALNLTKLRNGEVLEVGDLKLKACTQGVSEAGEGLVLPQKSVYTVCMKCQKFPATRTKWEEGEEYKVCENCWNPKKK